MSGRIAEHFRLQADACDAMGSPFTARICRLAPLLLNHDTKTGSAILNWKADPRDDAVALRLAGALHGLVLRGSDPNLVSVYPPREVDDSTLETAVADAIDRHDEHIASVLKNAPQTNETARSAALLPGFLAIARQTGLPLALNEIGSSAGLNLFFDRFRYRYDAIEWGDPSYPQVLAPTMRSGVPDLSGDLRIASRSGTDLAPVDVGEMEDRLRLRSYVWPDQPGRLSRLDAAINVAHKNGFDLAGQDAADFVEDRLDSRKAGETFVLFHSVVWQYLPLQTKDRITSAMNRAGNKATPDAPLAWLSMEGQGGVEPFAAVHLTVWPGGRMRKLAHADFHARWLDWME